VRRAAVVAALALLGCTSAPPTERVSGPGFVLVSPFEQEATGEWRDLVAEDVAAVAALFRSGVPDPPATVVLDAVDIPGDATLSERLDPRVEGLGGQATADGRIRLVVAREGGGLVSTSNHAKLRHELAHLFLHRRCPHAPLWLHEGLAHEVDDAVMTRTGLAFHPAPVRLAVARALVTDAGAASLWTWERSPRPAQEEESARRALSSSFVRFLLEREGSGWPDALPRLAALRPADEPELVAAWRTWLGRLDYAALVERGTAAPDPAIRAGAANALATLAEAARTVPALGESVGAGTDAVALRVLSDPACWPGAATYLAWFRAGALPDADVAGLLAPGAPPASRLVGLAIAARRGAAVDDAEVRSLCAALPDHLRVYVVVLRPFLPGVDAGDNPHFSAPRDPGTDLPLRHEGQTPPEVK
jgi:hypothetical protein